MPIYTFTDSSSGSHVAANGENLTANAQDNPVEITEKYIYIIKNYINDKVYIGQAIDPEARFKGHISDSKRKSETSAIDGAIYKYGPDNFYYEILEDKTTEYNEREKYWISFYNSICPNGYNILHGGENPPIRRGFDNNKCKFTPEDINEIKKLLEKYDIPMKDIASAYKVSYRTISNINSGKTYKNDKSDYPIRKINCSGEIYNQPNKNIVIMVSNEILNTEIPLGQIALKFNLSYKQVSNINNGYYERYKLPGFTYPIRDTKKIDINTAKKIRADLLSGILSKNKIASKYNVSYSVVSNINSGRDWFDKDLVYPLKKHEGRYNYSEDVWENIRKMLKNNVSIKKITNILNLPNESIVRDINVGKAHKSPNYEYPIQQYKNRFSYEEIINITNDIANTSKSLTQIAKEHNACKSTIIQIKNGAYKKYKLQNYTYPLR